jgi:hypothetical protein
MPAIQQRMENTRCERKSRLKQGGRGVTRQRMRDSISPLAKGLAYSQSSMVWLRQIAQLSTWMSAKQNIEGAIELVVSVSLKWHRPLNAGRNFCPRVSRPAVPRLVYAPHDHKATAFHFLISKRFPDPVAVSVAAVDASLVSEAIAKDESSSAVRRVKKRAVDVRVRSN